MWIETRTNNKGTRYVYSERFTDPVTGKQCKVSVTLNSKNNRTKKEAAHLLLAKFTAKQEAVPSLENHLKGLTFETVAKEWLDQVRPTIKPTSFKMYTVYANGIIRRIPTDLLFTDFTPAVAKKVVTDAHYTEQRSYSYATNVLHITKKIVEYAKQAGYIKDIAVFKEVKLRRRPMTQSELNISQNKFLNQDELNSALEQLSVINHRVARMMEFMALTGLRSGELLALRTQDYDKNHQLINVNGTMIRLEDGWHRGTPKNVFSYREVILNERAVSIIEQFLLENRRASKWTPDQYHDNGYIFTDEKGFPYKPNRINATLKKVHIPNKKLTTHIFRHTHICMLVEMGLPLKTIMCRVGHHDPQTTLEVYTHVTAKMDQELAQKLKELKV